MPCTCVRHKKPSLRMDSVNDVVLVLVRLFAVVKASMVTCDPPSGVLIACRGKLARQAPLTAERTSVGNIWNKRPLFYSKAQEHYIIDHWCALFFNFVISHDSVSSKDVAFCRREKIESGLGFFQQIIQFSTSFAV